MRDLPSRGLCHAAFLLAYSARVRQCDDIDGWLSAVVDKPTYMATSLDIAGTARLLIDVGLARLAPGVIVSRELARLDQIANTATFKGIARLLLIRRPPDWLRAAVVDGRLAPEFIPGSDLESLSWMGTDLEPVIVAAHGELYGAVDDALLKHLGDAGEFAVMSALELQGLIPRHVALISDRFGYDIELGTLAKRVALEVKAAVTSTAARLFVSRNEFEMAKRMGDRWKIVQVTFSTSVIARGVARADDIEGIRELSSSSLMDMAPAESDIFRWIATAEFRPDPGMWRPSDLVVPRGFRAGLALN